MSTVLVWLAALVHDVTPGNVPAVEGSRFGVPKTTQVSMRALSAKQPEISTIRPGNIEPSIVREVEMNSLLSLAVSALLMQDAAQYMNRGVDKANKNDFKGAIEDFSKVIELMPKNYRAYLNRGICKEQLKDLDGAVADYTKTIELFPSHPDAYNNRGGIRKSKSDLDGALADFNKVIEVAGKDLKPYHFLNRGLVWQDKKEWNRVVEDFTQALALDPKFVNAYIRRGMVQQELKNADAAIADYNKVLEIDPGNTSIYLTQV